MAALSPSRHLLESLHATYDARTRARCRATNVGLLPGVRLIGHVQQIDGKQKAPGRTKLRLPDRRRHLHARSAGSRRRPVADRAESCRRAQYGAAAPVDAGGDQCRQWHGVRQQGDGRMGVCARRAPRFHSTGPPSGECLHRKLQRAATR